MIEIDSVSKLGMIYPLTEGDSKTILGLTDRVMTGQSVVLMNDEKTAAVTYDMLIEGKWLGHILSKPEVRGKQLWAFGVESLRYLIEYFGMEQCLFFAAQHRKDLNLFLRRYGLKSLGQVGAHELYVADKEQVLAYAKEV